MTFHKLIGKQLSDNQFSKIPVSSVMNFNGMELISIYKKKSNSSRNSFLTNQHAKSFSPYYSYTQSFVHVGLFNFISFSFMMFLVE